MASALSHDLRLAVLSFRRNPLLTMLMIGAIAAGIGAALITMTLYHAKSGNPIWWKNDQLYAVALDLRSDDPEATRNQRRPELPPAMLAYRDAQALYRSEIPKRQVIMYRSRFLIDPPHQGIKPFGVVARVTTADFFRMFDVPFLYGDGWTRAADDGPESVVVLSKHTNERLFAGANSVGRTVSLDGNEFRVIGVLDHWLPQPKFYDVTTGAFDLPEDVFIPFGWTEARQLNIFGSLWCLNEKTTITSFQDRLNADCVWMQYWAEMPKSDLKRYQQFADNYVMDQKKLGRFPRPLNNRVVNVSEWLEMQDVVGDDSRMQVALALMFLVICIFNTVGLILAKFLGAASITGLRRALGASRRDIIRQHLLEVLTIGIAGGIAGLALAKGGLWLLRNSLFAPGIDRANNPDALAIGQSLTHLDGTMLVIALGISIVTGLLAGFYPAWRIGRMPPAIFLKSQ
jgi:putative ABC transport system permease protein